MSLRIGDPAPWFTLPSPTNPNYRFDTVGGYRVLLFFFGSTSHPNAASALQQFFALQAEFAQLEIPFFGVSVDPNDQNLADQIHTPAFFKLLWDFEQQVSQQYGVCRPLEGDRGRMQYTPTTFILDEGLRIADVVPLQDPDTYAAQLLHRVQSLPPLAPPAPAIRQAPVLLIPNVFDRAFCQHLIDQYEADGGRDSGFMRQIDGKTVEVLDHSFKQRRDYLLSEPKLLQAVNELILRRIKPEIEKAFQFSITRFERHLIGCYDADRQGFFNRHRDNTTKGTAHRRFAMTLNLNTGDYEGGYLRFPEFGAHLYRPEAGEAVIFSCSLLHEVTPVTQGRRFALLSFFYNDEDAQLREQNRRYVVLQDQEKTSDAEPRSPQLSTPAAKGRGFQAERRQKRR